MKYYLNQIMDSEIVNEKASDEKLKKLITSKFHPVTSLKQLGFVKAEILLSCGTFGQVYSGTLRLLLNTDKSLLSIPEYEENKDIIDTRVAIKLSKRCEKAFKNESTLYQKYFSQNIIVNELKLKKLPIVYYYGSGGIISRGVIHANYLILPFAEGGDMFLNIPIKVNKYITLWNSLIKGLEYIHSLGFAHNDLKPENLLMMKNGDYTSVKITDFGLMKKFQFKAKHIGGTYGFMPHISKYHIIAPIGDYESLYYTFLNMLTGKISWFGKEYPYYDETYQPLKKIGELCYSITKAQIRLDYFIMPYYKDMKI